MDPTFVYWMDLRVWIEWFGNFGESETTIVKIGYSRDPPARLLAVCRELPSYAKKHTVISECEVLASSVKWAFAVENEAIAKRYEEWLHRRFLSRRCPFGMEYFDLDGGDEMEFLGSAEAARVGCYSPDGIVARVGGMVGSRAREMGFDRFRVEGQPGGALPDAAPVEREPGEADSEGVGGSPGDGGFVGGAVGGGEDGYDVGCA